MTNNPHFPDWMDVLQTFLEKNFTGKICVIFCNPCENGIDSIRKHFKTSEQHMLVCCEYAILEVDEIEKALNICNETPDSNPYTLVWENTQIVHENT